MAPGMKEDDLNACFKKFDANGDGGISFSEFKRTLTEGMSIDS